MSVDVIHKCRKINVNIENHAFKSRKIKIILTFQFNILTNVSKREEGIKKPQTDLVQLDERWVLQKSHVKLKKKAFTFSPLLAYI